MQKIAAGSRQPAIRHHRMELLKFGFELLIDHQQRPECAPDVAIAAGDDSSIAASLGLEVIENPPIAGEIKLWRPARCCGLRG